MIKRGTVQRQFEVKINNRVGFISDEALIWEPEWFNGGLSVKSQQKYKMCMTRMFKLLQIVFTIADIVRKQPVRRQTSVAQGSTGNCRISARFWRGGNEYPEILCLDEAHEPSKGPSSKQSMRPSRQFVSALGNSSE
jgi:hypothetical protein